jgi:hypothetical protein
MWFKYKPVADLRLPSLVTLVAIGILSIGSVWGLETTAHAAGSCAQEKISSDVSPNGSWSAVLLEENCTDGMFVSTAVDIIQLVGPDEIPNRANDVFTVDRPAVDHPKLAIEWLSSEELRIIVPNNYPLGTAKSSYRGVHVQVTYK